MYNIYIYILYIIYTFIYCNSVCFNAEAGCCLRPQRLLPNDSLTKLLKGLHVAAEKHFMDL